MSATDMVVSISEATSRLRRWADTCDQYKDRQAFGTFFQRIWNHDAHRYEGLRVCAIGAWHVAECCGSETAAQLHIGGTGVSVLTGEVNYNRLVAAVIENAPDELRARVLEQRGYDVSLSSLNDHYLFPLDVFATGIRAFAQFLEDEHAQAG